MTPREWAAIVAFLIILVAASRLIVKEDDDSKAEKERESREWNPDPNMVIDPLTKCPNPRYLHRHVCDWCKTVEDSFKFSKDRREANVEFNTVVFTVNKFGEDVTYHEVNNHSVCTNLEVARIDECDLLVAKKCVTRGFLCRARHATDTGHLWYKETECFGWEKYYPYTMPWSDDDEDSDDDEGSADEEHVTDSD